MNLLERTIHLCNIHNIKPARSKGQNFLIKEGIYDEIIKVAQLKKDDVVLEVGPGLGFLTEKLTKQVKKVVAVELDDKLVGVLVKRLKEQGIENVEVVNENILEIFNYLRSRQMKQGGQLSISNKVPIFFHQQKIYCKYTDFAIRLLPSSPHFLITSFPYLIILIKFDQ